MTTPAGKLAAGDVVEYRLAGYRGVRFEVLERTGNRTHYGVRVRAISSGRHMRVGEELHWPWASMGLQWGWIVLRGDEP